MNKFKYLATLLITLGISSCGGGGGCDNALTGSGGCGTTLPGESTVATIQLLASSPQLPSDQSGNKTVALTAIARDANGVFLADVSIQFAVTNGSGGLGVSQPITDASGTALAQVSSGGDPTNRSITITASSGTVSDSVDILVTGTTLLLSGPAALAAGDSANYSIVLADSEGVGIANVLFTPASANGNTVSSATSSTGFNGEATITLTGDVGGLDSLSVLALGLSTAKAVNISNDRFEFVMPDPDTEIDLGDVQALEVLWETSGLPVVGSSVQFSSTRGTLSASSDATDGSGIATVNISSTNSGPAVVTATDPISGTSTSLNIEFVATTPDTLELQASPFTVVTGQQSSITAIVRDAGGNLVKNQLVSFQLDDITGGFLSVASNSTDSQGRARTFYTGGSTPSATDGVTITATVDSTPSATDFVKLTVAGVERDITIGTGNEMFELGTALYAREWVILVKDAVGNGVPDSSVQVSVTSIEYGKGTFVNGDPMAIPEEPSWVYDDTVVWCLDEDIDHDGILDFGEDINNNGTIEAGGDAVVAAVDINASLDNPCDFNNTGTQGSAANVMTNAQGIARVCMYYPQNFALWLDVEIEAQATVSGTEFTTKQLHTLSVLNDDFNDADVEPPNRISPYGIGDACADPD